MNHEPMKAILEALKQGTATIEQQRKISDEYMIMRGMAIRLERCVHDLIKSGEHLTDSAK